MEKNGIIIESVDPKKFLTSELKQIAEVEKDMWAYGIGEYVKCKNCGQIHSKNDIFGHLSNEIKTESVTKLEEIIAGDSIRCNKCEGDTDFIFDVDNNIIEIKKRLFESKVSFLSILKDTDNGEIKGFMDGYIDNLFNIYEREFSSHYERIGYEEIKYAIKRSLNNEEFNDLFTISSLGTLQKYTNFKNLSDLVRVLLFSIDNKYNNYLTISEFDTGTNIHSFFHAIGFNKININKEVSNKSAFYNSNLYIHKNLLEVYKKQYYYPPKQFIKIYGKKMKEVLVNNLN